MTIGSLFSARQRRFRRLWFAVRWGSPLALCSLLTAVWLTCVAISGPRTQQPRIHALPGHDTVAPDDLLTVMTINVAHGRGNSVVQRLVRPAEARRNLERIAALIARENAHVVALQEADVRAFWSGRFNHVGYIAEHADLPRFAHMANVNGLGLRYGTSLLAATDLQDTRAGTFAPSPPTFPKGWISARVPWRHSPTGQVTVVSVHLDFSRQGQRHRQIAELVAALRNVDDPLIVMGDLNCDVTADEGMRALLETAQLKAWSANDGQNITFPATEDRIDWILLSSNLRFVRYDVIEEPLSDHYAVVGAVAWAAEPLAGP